MQARPPKEGEEGKAVTQGDRLKKLENGHKRHGRDIRDLRALIRDGLEAHEKEMRDHERRMKDSDKRMEMLDQRILNLVSGFGEFLRQLRAGKAQK
jgi:hypothetical protein